MAQHVVLDQAPGAMLTPAMLERLAALVTRPRFASPNELVEAMQAIVPRYPPPELRCVVSHLLRQSDARACRWRFDPRMLAFASGPVPPSEAEQLARLARISCSTLLVRGAESESVTREQAERRIAALGDGRLVDIPAARHSLVGENTAGVRAAIRQFLSE